MQKANALNTEDRKITEKDTTEIKLLFRILTCRRARNHLAAHVVSFAFTRGFRFSDAVR